jgi:TolB-like protein
MAEKSSGKGKWLTPLLAALLAVLAFAAWNFYSPRETSLAEHPRPARNQIYFGEHKSIAVLPFELQDAQEGQEFWSVGFSGELTRLLTLVRGLTVTSRNSALYFRDRDAADLVIAERLQVNNLLFGTFRFSGPKVNLDFRLFSARRNKDVWTQSQELEIGQMFGVQASLLRDVTAEIGAGNAGMDLEIEAVNAEAWISYLRGIHHQQSRTMEGFLEAETAFRAALAVEPAYELARLAMVSTWLARSASGDSTPLLVENARTELQKVIQSNSARPEAQGLASYISRNYDWDWAAAVDAGHQAVRLNPGDPGLKSIASLALFSVGRFEHARVLKEEAVKQDPLNLAGRLRLGLLQEFAADYDAALASYRNLLGMNPDFPGVRAFRARIKLIQQKPEAAMKESEQETDAFWKRYSGILALTASERTEEAAILLERMMAEDGPHAAYQIAEILAFQGDLDGAFDWLDRAYLQRDGGMKELLGNFFLKNLHEDPRWAELLGRLGLPLDLESQSAYGNQSFGIKS